MSVSETKLNDRFMKLKKEEKLVIDISNLLEEQVYRKVMDKQWEEIERFRADMEEKISATSRFFAKQYVKEVLAPYLKKVIK